MCLAIKTQKDKFPNKGYYYKVYQISDFDKLEVKPLFYGKSFLLRSNIVIQGNRKSTMLSKQELTEGAVHKGIHVCNTLAEAKKYSNDDSNRIIVAVTGSIEDFVAIGNDNKQSVFTKVKISHIVGESYTQRRFTALNGYITTSKKLPVETVERFFDFVVVKV